MDRTAQQKKAVRDPRDPVFLMAAARYGNLNKVRDLIEKQHYEVDMVGDEGFTALLVACVNKRANVVEYLVNAGANVFEKNAAGDTPYDVAKALHQKDTDSSVWNAVHGGMLTLGECKVCFENDVSLYTLPCGDQACVECIRNWFVSLLNDNDPLKCPAAECQEMADDETTPPDHVDAWRLLSRADYLRYQQQLLNRMLVALKDFQHCVRCESGGFFERAEGCNTLTCVDCEETWCRQCRLPPHKDLTCEEFAERYNWQHQLNMKCIADQCKKCPKCKAQIERDGGCSHMRCGQCKFEFCWWCLRKYRPGQYTFGENGDCPCPKDDDEGDIRASGGWA